MDVKNTNILFSIILGGATLLFLYLLKPFFFPIFWAAVIAGIFHPLYRRIYRRMNSPTLSTMIVFLVIAVLILLPAGIVGKLVFNESIQLYGTLSPDKKNINQSFEHVIDAIVDTPL